MKIKYMSHGIHKTGGSVYEQFFTDQLAAEFSKSGIEPAIQLHHDKRIFRGIQNIRLFFSGFSAGAEINIVVFRYALAAMIRNLFNNKVVLAVMHNYDPADYKSWLLRIYSWKFFLLLKLFHPKRFAIITVAPFWQEYFSKRFPKTKVFLYPNLFRNSYYRQFSNIPKKKKIHLGQFSPKNDPAIFDLAERLAEAGYECYFTSLRSEEQTKTGSYSIKFCSFEEYLQEMAESEYTLALTAINEGWNRIAHESLLVNTPVIGYAKGGLGNLLNGSESLIVHSIDEAIDVILRNQKPGTNKMDFPEHFDISKSAEYLEDLVSWINNKNIQNERTKTLVSVLMPVYNAAGYLHDSIESILKQTYSDFEFIIVNDGSTDHSEEIILSFQDPRIRYFKLEENKGNAFARNFGLEKATGKFVMIQDSDDISLPHRMQTQVSFMETHPWVGVCGSWMKVNDGIKEYIRKYPTDADLIRSLLFSKNPVAQPTVMIRKKVFDIYHLRHLKYYEDFNLWYQASKVTAIVNIPEVLVKYNYFENSQKLRHRLIKEHVVQLIFRQKLDELAINVPEEEIDEFSKFMKGYTEIDRVKYRNYLRYLNLIEKANKVRKIYLGKAFSTTLLYDRLRLWKFRYKNNSIGAIFQLPQILTKILCNFDKFVKIFKLL